MKNVKKFIKPVKPFSLLLLYLTVFLPVTVFAEEIQIPASRDATLIESAEGNTANGSGPIFFAGRTNQPAHGIRRALVYFDVASALPKNAIIDFANLTLYQQSNNPEEVDVSLYRLQTGWGEGVSSSSGGRGRPAENGDSTWLHRFWPSRQWQQPGGEFISRASATQSVAGDGVCRWPGTSHLINDVRLWLQQPEQNFGWLLRGDENTPGTAKRFSSRESNDIDRRPILTVRYHLPGNKH